MKRIYIDIIGCPHRVILVSRVSTCLRGNNSNDCVQRSPASPNPCSDTLSPLLSSGDPFFTFHPGLTPTLITMFIRMFRLTQPLSRVTQPLGFNPEEFYFQFPVFKTSETEATRGNDWLSRILRAISPRGILFWQEHYSDIFLWRPERVKMCPWGTQMFSAPFHLYHVSWIRFKWFSIEIFIHNFPSACKIWDMHWDSNYCEVTQCFVSFSPQLVLSKSHVSLWLTSEMSELWLKWVVVVTLMDRSAHGGGPGHTGHPPLVYHLSLHLPSPNLNTPICLLFYFLSQYNWNKRFLLRR